MTDVWRTITREAAEALTRYRAVVLDSNGKAAYPAVAGSSCIGLIHTSVSASDISTYGTHDVDIILAGIFRGEIGEAVANGQWLTGDIDGQLISATAWLLMNSSLANSDFIVRSRYPGLAGRNISIAMLDPAGNNQALACSVAGNDITISLATGPAGAITSTANEVMAIIGVTASAAALVSTELATGSTGVGVVEAIAKDFLDGGGNTVAIALQAGITAGTSIPVLVHIGGGA